ncbi:MAG: MFS transporter [Oscillospiraceae bacterium]|nr:MFS transporter [Oscillospiraceae bacterium]
MNLKKQILRLYLLEIFGSFSMTDGIWIIFLIQRGFSLVEVGIAETVFHITSFLFEVPSGAVADLFGRKKTMIASYLSLALSALLTITAWNLPSLCLAMVFTALGYNLNSGTRDALTYDSLKSLGEEGRYLSVNSNQRVLCSAAMCLSKLVTGIAGRIGYLWSYVCNMALNGSSILIIGGMTEPVTTDAQKNRAPFSFATIGRDILRQLTDSLGFLRLHPDITVKMMLDAMVGCSGTLTIFFLQQHFSVNAVPLGWIGVFLLIVEIGGMAGAKCAPFLARRIPFGRLACFCALSAALSVMLTGSAIPMLSVSGGFLLRFFSLILETATSSEVNQALPSDQRATLISVGSILFSIAMIAATPALSLLCEALGTGGAFAILGAVLLGINGAFLWFGRRSFRASSPAEQ